MQSSRSVSSVLATRTNFLLVGAGVIIFVVWLFTARSLDYFGETGKDQDSLELSRDHRDAIAEAMERADSDQHDLDNQLDGMQQDMHMDQGDAELESTTDVIESTTGFEASTTVETTTK